MFHPIPKGSVEIIHVEGYDYHCQLPPVGYGKNRLTGEIEYIGVRSISTKQKEQKWEPLVLPAWWKERRKKEIKEQLADKDYFDAQCEEVRTLWWKHRLCGMWYKINGKDTYITGTFWYYLTNCPLDVGLPKYRDTDRRFFYVWEYCVEDPCCGGLVDIERRRMGKTYKSGAILLDRTSLFSDHHGTIQSKTGPDAKSVFLKTVVRFFKKSVDFFRPVYDTSKGVTPTTELRFFQTVVKGKKAEDILDGEELESWIDWFSSDVFALDGQKTGTQITDEFGKTIECDAWERLNVNRYCIDQDGAWCGKALYTSTIEEMESGGKAAKRIWESSNPNVKDENGRTESGMYWFFLPAFETIFFDEFGMPDIERGKVFYLNQRKGLENDPRNLSSNIRKNPFTIAEAFRIDGDMCLYDAEKLNNQRDIVSWSTNVVTRGNLVWENGERDTKVKWEESKTGRWYACWLFSKPGESNQVDKVGNVFRPKNNAFIIGADPFSHDKVDDNRRSDGACLVKMKYDINDANNPYNDSFVMMYKARPAAASLYYEDMIKTAVFFGCKILFESNKNNWKQYFVDRGYEHFLVKLKGYSDYGIPGNKQTHQQLAEATEEYILNSCGKVWFEQLLSEWLEFDIDNTTKFDVAMAAGYTLIADKKVLFQKGNGNLKKITDYGFKKRKARA
jgi:hypothetical protein